MEARGWQDERLRVMVLEALALAKGGGFIRLFADEGEAMRLLILDFRLLIEKQLHGQDYALLGYMDRLLAAYGQPAAMPQSKVENPKSKMLEPVSDRELEILALLAQGLSNRVISERLFLAPDTVKGHNRRVFDKLQVQSHTEAMARARELGLL